MSLSFFYSFISKMCTACSCCVPDSFPSTPFATPFFRTPSSRRYITSVGFKGAWAKKDTPRPAACTTEHSPGENRQTMITSRTVWCPPWGRVCVFAHVAISFLPRFVIILCNTGGGGGCFCPPFSHPPEYGGEDGVDFPAKSLPSLLPPPAIAAYPPQGEEAGWEFKTLST